MAEPDKRDGAEDGLFYRVIRHFLTTPASHRGARDAGEAAEPSVPPRRDADE